jgi:hypothetical protein
MTKNALRIAAEGELLPGQVADPAMFMMAAQQQQQQGGNPGLTIVPPPASMNMAISSHTSQQSHSPNGSVHSHHSHHSHASTPVKDECCTGHNTPPTIVSAHTSPDGSFHNTPTSGFGEFMRPTSSTQSNDNASPQPFMNLDWSQMQVPMNFDHIRPDMLSPGMAFSPGAFMNGHMMEPMAFMTTQDGMPAGYPFPQLQTPLHTPGLEQMEHCFPNMMPMGMEHQMPLDSPPESLSIPTEGDIDNNPACLDAWTAFRCNPSVPSSNCPKTAKINLERLEQTLKSHDNWANWRPTYDEADFALGDNLAVTPLQEMPRDKLLAITQSFLHRALDIHKDEQGFSASGLHTPSNNYGSGFVILPPARVLECFLRSYVNGFERYFPLTAKGTLNANELLHGYNDRASSLLVLLMMAQGAMLTPSVDARWLTAGLTEACRISLFNLIESNITMSSDPQVLHAALLFIVQAAWSGDKWQMDIAMGQRGVYFAMLRHSGLLEGSQQNNQVGHDVDSMWNNWMSQESRSRLIYSWAMADQDLALFHDVAPLFSVTEFNEPMPDSDALWHAKSATEWSSIFEQVHEFSGGASSVGSGVRPLSLKDLFRHFLDDAIVSQGIELTPLQLRLLLHPLQSLVCQFRQLLSCFSDSTLSAAGNNSFTAASTRLRLEEVQALLQRWFALADRYMKANPLCPLMQASLVIFHLISLNAVTNFPEIEKLARREEVDGSFQQLAWLHKRAISDVEEAVFHCGQVIRHIRAMPRSIRPSWWAGAIYRVGLILWTDSLMHNDNNNNVNKENSFAIDALTPDHPMVVRYLSKREGTPMVTKRDGSLMPVDNAFGVLFHCVDVIGEGVSTRFADGIANKLERLAKGGR